jgi:hypothetical protein
MNGREKKISVLVRKKCAEMSIKNHSAIRRMIKAAIRKIGSK